MSLEDHIASWFSTHAKVPLSEEEKKKVSTHFREAGVDIDLLHLAEDADLRELCPPTFSLARKWLLKEAIKYVRGERWFP